MVPLILGNPQIARSQGTDRNWDTAVFLQLHKLLASCMVDAQASPGGQVADVEIPDCLISGFAGAGQKERAFTRSIGCQALLCPPC